MLSVSVTVSVKPQAEHRYKWTAIDFVFLFSNSNLEPFTETSIQFPLLYHFSEDTQTLHFSVKTPPFLPLIMLLIPSVLGTQCGGERWSQFPFL